MKRNFIHNYSTGNLHKLFVYCVRPVLIVSFLFCQLSFQTNIGDHVYGDEIRQTEDFVKPANILTTTSPQTRLQSDGPIETVIQSGNNVPYPTPVKIKKAGKRSVEIYRIML